MVGTLLPSVEERTIPASLSTIYGVSGAGTPPKNKYRSAEGSTLMYSRLEKWDGSSRLLLCNHGHGGYSNQFGQNVGPGLGLMALVRTGRYIVLSIDGGPTPAEWGCAMAMEACRDAIAWAYANGVKPGKYAGMGWSMGGLTTLNWMRRDPNYIGAWLWVPALDLNWLNSTAGYVPDYGVPIPSNNTWKTEISTGAQGVGYRAQSQITAAVNIPDSTTPVGQGITIPVQDASRFSDCLEGRSTIAITGSAVFATYGRKDRTNLYDVISVGAAFSNPGGVANYATQGWGYSNIGYDPYAEYADFQPAKFGANRKVGLALTTDDGTLPPPIADAWIAKVNNPNIGPVGPKTLGNHTNMFPYYNDAEIVSWFDSLDWS